jgi:histidine triad (HIT) family protein
MEMKATIDEIILQNSELGLSDKYDFYCEEALSGKIKIDILFDSDDVLAFYHTRPFWEKHIVIIPKKHIKDLINVSDEDMHIITQIMKVARDLAKNLNLSKGVKVLTNLGKFQDTPHVHFHLAEGEEMLYFTQDKY